MPQAMTENDMDVFIMNKQKKTPEKGRHYAHAMLELKKAFGVDADAWYEEIGQDFEIFNYGQDLSFLDNVYDHNSWLMDFSHEISEGVEETVTVGSRFEDQENLCVTHRLVIDGKWGNDVEIYKVTRKDFINPETWAVCISVILERSTRLRTEQR